jgi:hypothetical protein
MVRAIPIFTCAASAAAVADGHAAGASARQPRKATATIGALRSHRELLKSGT